MAEDPGLVEDGGASSGDDSEMTAASAARAGGLLSLFQEQRDRMGIVNLAGLRTIRAGWRGTRGAQSASDTSDTRAGRWIQETITCSFLQCRRRHRRKQTVREENARLNGPRVS